MTGIKKSKALICAAVLLMVGFLKDRLFGLCDNFRHFRDHPLHHAFNTRF